MRTIKTLLALLIAPAIFVSCTHVEHDHDRDVMVGTTVKETRDVQTTSPDGTIHRKVTYYYYPADQIYRNPTTDEWVWMENGMWRREHRPPLFYRADQADQYVIVDIQDDSPERYHSEIIQTYPRTYVIQRSGDNTVIRERTEKREYRYKESR